MLASNAGAVMVPRVVPKQLGNGVALLGLLGTFRPGSSSTSGDSLSVLSVARWVNGVVWNVGS